MNTIVRCFKRLDKGDLRHGVWIFTEPNGPRLHRGAFIHGDRNEVQPPDYTVTDMESMAMCPEAAFIQVKEITPEEALAEIENWPEGQEAMQAAFDRHPAESVQDVAEGE